jgi:hypothetical protein
MRGSGRSRPNVPTIRADQHDPIPQERTLDEAKKIRPAEVAELKKRGHFIESTDGRFYAYANTDLRSRSSHIRVVDSATGKLIGAATINSVVGPLEFTDDGVASRETDGVLQLRVPLPTPDSQSANKPSDVRVAPGMRVPALASAQGVSARDILAFKAETPGLDYDQPADVDIDSCRVALEPGAAWSLLSREGVLLRRFEDTNRDGVVDSWRYYKAGIFVYRDVDSDYDGRADRHQLNPLDATSKQAE